jgi:hypothetical protein
MTGRLDPDALMVPEDFTFQPGWNSVAAIGAWGGDRWSNIYPNSFNPEAVYYSPDDLSVAPIEYTYGNVGEEANNPLTRTSGNNPLGQSDLHFAYDWQNSDERAALLADGRESVSIEDRVKARLDYSLANGYKAFEWGTDMSFMDDWQRSGIDADYADWKAENPDEYSEKKDYQEDTYTREWFNTDAGRRYVNNILGDVGVNIKV